MNNIIRISFITSDVQEKTFKKNLLKVIKVILYDNIKGLTLQEIKYKILKDYKIEVTKDEIQNAINIDKGEIRNFKLQNNKLKYILTPDKIDKMSKMETSNRLKKVINRFIESCNIDISYKKLYELINDFIYVSINTNIEVMGDLINKNISEDFFKNVTKKIYTDEEREYINTFLNWDDIEKNQLLFNIITFAMDYCFLTIKKDYKTLRNVFSGKRFYLDANVIFRMIGLNNEERKKAINSFVNKSSRLGIEFRYTNFTLDEIENTIEKSVHSIKEILQGKQPMDLKVITNFLPPYANGAFLEMYYEWLENNKDKYGDYRAFEKYVNRIVREILKDFKKIDIIDYSKTKKYDDYKCFCTELASYKNQANRRYTSRSIQVDINNFMYMVDIRSKAKGINLFDVNDYLISTDGNLCNWAKGVIPGSVPLIVLPSVWHSLVLKYSGRVEDDYLAYNAFMKLRLRNNDNTEFDQKRLVILHKVQNLAKPTKVKNLILEDIDEKIRGKYLNDINTDDIIEESSDFVIKEMENKIIENSRATIEKDAEKNTIRAIAKGKVKKRIKNGNRIKKIASYCFFISAIIATICVFLIVGLEFVDIEKMTEDELKKISIIIGILQIGIGLVSKIITISWRGINANFTEEELIEKEVKKLNKTKTS